MIRFLQLSFTMSCRSLLRHPTSPLSACSCQQYASSKHIKQLYPERSQRKSVSPSLTIALTAGAASVAVVFTATLAVYFLMYRLDSTIITSTTSNRVVSTTTHSTALSGARLLDNATSVQTSIRGSLANPLVQTQNDDVKDLKLEISTIAGKGDAGAWPKVAWLMSFPKYVLESLTVCILCFQRLNRYLMYEFFPPTVLAPLTPFT